MAIVSLVEMLASGMTNTDGTPIASGRVRFYSPGTLTPITAYSDSPGSTAITPPLILTAGGTGTAYITTSTRMIVKDSTDTNTLFDGVAGTTPGGSVQVSSSMFSGQTINVVLDAWGTSTGGSEGLDWRVSTGSTGTTGRYLKSIIVDNGQEPQAYGAAVDGATNDATAFSRAITAAGTGKVYLPAGTYAVATAVAVSSAVEFVGSGVGNTILKLTGGTENMFTVSGASGSVSLSHMTITHSSTTTGAVLASSSTSATPMKLTDVAITPGTFRFAVSSTGTCPIIAVDAALLVNTADTSSIGVKLATAATTFTATATTITGYLNGILCSTASKIRLLGGSVTSSNGDAIVSNAGGAGSDVYVNGTLLSGGGTYAIDIASGVVDAEYSRAIVTAGAIRDARTGAPNAYSLAVNGSVTPLPMQTSEIRITATAAITVTVNAISATGFGRKWTLYCINNSGGAVTWSFNAQYKLIGAAAPAPATGNFVSMALEYDPISSVVREYAARGSGAI